MTPSTVLAVLAAVAAAMSVVVATAAAFGTTNPRVARPSARERLRQAVSRLGRARRARRVGLAVLAGVLVWLVSGWPAAGAIAVAGVIGVPWVFSAGRDAQRQVDRLAGLEEWVRRVADSTAAGAAPVQAITVTARHPPAAIAGEVTDLAAALGNPRADKQAALRRFADRIDDPAGDITVLALTVAITGAGPQRLPDMLRTVAGQVADDVGTRRKIETERAEPRNEARTIIIIFGVVVGVVAAQRHFAAPYGTMLGQLVLLLLAAVVAAAMVLLRRLSAGTKPPRILNPAPEPATAIPSRAGVS